MGIGSNKCLWYNKLRKITKQTLYKKVDAAPGLDCITGTETAALGVKAAHYFERKSPNFDNNTIIDLYGESCQAFYTVVFAQGIEAVSFFGADKKDTSG
jgi:hypothetical protein